MRYPDKARTFFFHATIPTGRTPEVLAEGVNQPPGDFNTPGLVAHSPELFPSAPTRSHGRSAFPNQSVDGGSSQGSPEPSMGIELALLAEPNAYRHSQGQSHSKTISTGRPRSVHQRRQHIVGYPYYYTGNLRITPSTNTPARRDRRNAISIESRQFQPGMTLYEFPANSHARPRMRSRFREWLGPDPILDNGTLDEITETNNAGRNL